MRFKQLYPSLLIFSLALLALGLLMDDPRNIWPGMMKIFTMPDVLITDYIEIAGIGAALINAGVVTLFSVFLLHRSDHPLNGYTVVVVALMAGFSLFGKNILNIMPIIAGTYLYALVRREHVSKYVSVALLSTSLAPVVSFVALESKHGSILVGILFGIAIGFFLPALSAYTYRIQNGMNLYNMGFACGLMAMMLVPIMTAMGDAPEKALYWSTGNNLLFAVALGILFTTLIICGLFFSGHPAWAAWAGYRRLLRTTGRAPSDYLRMFGASPVLINMGINGIVVTAILLATGGDLNGPTIGGIFTIVGFSAYGKHVFNIVPIMVGLLLGSVIMQFSISDCSVQIALLFSTTLAPISGYFGWPYGIIAGFLHSAVVLQAGSVLEGVNLYNNGFAGGLVAIVLYPVIMSVVKHRRAALQEEDYFDIFEEDKPMEANFSHFTQEETPE